MLLLLPCIVHTSRLLGEVTVFDPFKTSGKTKALLSVPHLHLWREIEKAMQDFLSEARAVQVLLPKTEEKLEHFSVQESENMKSER